MDGRAVFGEEMRMNLINCPLAISKLYLNVHYIATKLSFKCAQVDNTL